MLMKVSRELYEMSFGVISEFFNEQIVINLNYLAMRLTSDKSIGWRNDTIPRFRSLRAF